MSFKAIILCASALLVQVITAGPISCSCTCVSESGGPLKITSIGPISPSGIAVASELALAGELAVSGALPFLSAVAFEGKFPTAGQASVAYGCGDGKIAIVEEIGNRCGKPISKSSLSY